MIDVVDAHYHTWDVATCPHPWLVDYPTLGGRYDLGDFAVATRSSPLAGSILVQAASDEHESSALLAAAANNPVVSGVVGFVDLTLVGAADRIAEQQASRGGHLLVGLRQSGGPSSGWLEAPALLIGLEAAFERQLIFDLLVRTADLPAVVRLAQRFPEGRLVLDHGAKPAIGSGSWQPWADLVAEVATCPNVSCKLSGLVNEAGDKWSIDMLRPYVDHLVRSFGPDRLMFGSDWPVCTAVATFHEVLAAARSLLLPVLGVDAAAQVFAGTAVSTYQLQLPDRG